MVRPMTVMMGNQRVAEGVADHDAELGHAFERAVRT